jgi:hypothetical protein
MHEMDMELPYKHLRQLYDANTEFVLVGNKYTKGLTFNPDKLVTINDINEIIILEDGIYKIYKESKTTGQPEY